MKVGDAVCRGGGDDDRIGGVASLRVVFLNMVEISRLFLITGTVVVFFAITPPLAGVGGVLLSVDDDEGMGFLNPVGVSVAAFVC